MLNFKSFCHPQSQALSTTCAVLADDALKKNILADHCHCFLDCHISILAKDIHQAECVYWRNTCLTSREYLCTLNIMGKEAT